MKKNKFLLLLGLLIGIQYAYAGPSSFSFVFHNTDPDKTMLVWMYDYPVGGVPYNYESQQTIPYRGHSSAISIAQDYGSDSLDGIRGYWGIQIKNKDNTVYCAIKLNYAMTQEICGPNDDANWCQHITFKKYRNYTVCPHKNLDWSLLPKSEGKPKHGTRFYKINFYINELHEIYYM